MESSKRCFAPLGVCFLLINVIPLLITEIDSNGWKHNRKKLRKNEVIFFSACFVWTPPIT